MKVVLCKIAQKLPEYFGYAQSGQTGVDVLWPLPLNCGREVAFFKQINWTNDPFGNYTHCTLHKVCLGREPWSSGYGKRLMFQRSWV